MINYSWCGIGQTGDGRVYKCSLAQLKELFMRFGTINLIFFGGGGGGGGGGGKVHVK